MADRRPLVSIAGRTKQLPIGDTISWNWLSNVPANLVSWASIAPSAKQDALGYTPVNKAGDTMTGQLYQNTTYSLYGYGGNAGSEQGFFGGWGNTGLWRQWPSAADHSTFVEVQLSYATGLKIQHNGTYIFDLNPVYGGNLRVPTVSIGDDIDILLYEGAANQLNIRTGPASAYKYFSFKASGSFSAPGLLWADVESGEAVRVGNDASLWDVNVQHILGVKSQTDAARGGIKFGDSGAILERKNVNDLQVSGGLYATGGIALLGFQDRSGSNSFGWYADGGVARLWHDGGSGDQLWTSNKDLYVGAAVYPGGWGTCYLYRVSSNILGVNQDWQVAGRIYANGQINVQGWIRSQYLGEGWFHEAGGGGIYMTDTTWIRTYGGKGFLCDNTVQGNRIEVTLGGLHQLSANSAAWIRQPRIFVQSGDPGAFASDGDLWFW